MGIRRGGPAAGLRNAAPILAQYTAAANAELADTTLFVADDGNYELLLVSEVHGTAGSDAAAVTLDVKRCTGTQAPSAGSTVLGSTFNLKGTANTVLYRKHSDATLTAAQCVVQQGERLCVDLTGTLTAVAGVRVQAWLRRTSAPEY